MKRISAALAVAALAVSATPVAAAPGASDPGAPRITFPERHRSHNSQQDVAADETMAIVLGGVLLFVVIAAPFFGAESRPGWRNVNRKPSFRMVGSMRPEDWPPSEFRR
jgi:hypothetical protein